MPRSAKIPTVRFNIKSTLQPSVPTLIVLVIRYNGQKLVYSTGEKIKPKHWDKKISRAKRTLSEYTDLNKRLNELADHATDIYKENGFGKISIDGFKLELAYRNGDKDRPNAPHPI